MLKLTMLAAVATTAALFAGSASAADLRVFSPANPAVHISLAGKSDAQIQSEILAAANTVCANNDGECLGGALTDAKAQLAAIAKSNRLAANPANVEVARADPSTIHVSLAGKTRSQIDSEIKEAAQTVCKATGETNFSGCVIDAVRDAKAQLRYIASTDQPRKIASN